MTKPGLTTSYGYNGLDARTSRTVGTSTTTYKRAGAYVTDPVLNETTGQFSANYTPGVSERRAGVSTFLHSGLKNADARTTDGSAVTADRQYDAFGNLTGGNGTWNGPFGYAGGFGYQEDGESGLKLLGHRYYDSSTGRFISKDPIGDGRNWYGYGAGETAPTHFADPDGLWRSRLIPLLDRAGRAVGDFFRGLGRLRPPGGAAKPKPVAGSKGATKAGLPPEVLQQWWNKIGYLFGDTVNKAAAAGKKEALRLLGLVDSAKSRDIVLGWLKAARQAPGTKQSNGNIKRVVIVTGPNGKQAIFETIWGEGDHLITAIIRP